MHLKFKINKLLYVIVLILRDKNEYFHLLYLMILSKKLK